MYYVYLRYVYMRNKKQATNPFVFGEVVGGEAFCDREAEQAALGRDLRDGEKLFLISPRRYGKTSLLQRVLATLRAQKVLTVYVDLYRASSLEEFIRLYCSAIAAACDTPLDKLVHFFREVLPRLRPQLSLDADGVPSVEIAPTLTPKHLHQALEEVVDLPHRIGQKKRRPVAVVLDEFQEIAHLEGEMAERTMRSFIQHHRGVGYVFSGSKKHLLEQMVRGANRAFYKMGKILYLDKIPRAAFAPFLQQRFAAGGMTVSAALTNDILDRTDDIPYHAQYLCHELWDRYRDARIFTHDDLETTVMRLVGEQEPIWLSFWDDLTSHQRRTLKAIATQGGTALFSNAVLSEYRLGPASTLQTSIRLLEKRGLIEKMHEQYLMTDVFFREWVGRTR